MSNREDDTPPVELLAFCAGFLHTAAHHGDVSNEPVRTYAGSLLAGTVAVMAAREGKKRIPPKWHGVIGVAVASAAVISFACWIGRGLDL